MKRLTFIAFLYCILMLHSAYGQGCAMPFGRVNALPDGNYQVVAAYTIFPFHSPYYEITRKRPYSAEEARLEIQTLPDGTKNESSRRSTFRYRDSAGRTRIEMPLLMPSHFLFPYDVDIPVIPAIFDPVAGHCYYLNTV
jgi:hypothetical protein